MRSTRGKLAVGSLLLFLSMGCGISHGREQRGSAGSDKAAEAIAVFRDPGRTQEELAEATQTLLSLGPAEVKPIEPVLLQILQSDASAKLDTDDLMRRMAEGDPDFLLWTVAPQVLSNLIPEPASIPVLIGFVQRHENPVVRLSAAYALGNLGPEARPAVPALVEKLRSDDHDETEIATFVLARIAPDPAVEAAVPLLTETVQGLEKGWPAQFNAAVALLKLGREREKARAVIRDVVYLGLMLPFLQDSKPANRLHVCEALRFFGPPQRDFLDLLRKTAAEDPDTRVREAAAQALREVAAAEQAGASAAEAPKALATLPPELAKAGKALIESNKALETGDVETYKKHLARERRTEFERNPRVSFFAAQHENILPALQLLGGILQGNSARIDVFSKDRGIYRHGSILMVREGDRWVEESGDWRNPALDQPAIDESTPLGRNERAAFDMLEAIGAAQIGHWDKSSPPTYSGALAQLLGRKGPPAGPIVEAGYVFTLTAGARSNAIDHAWSAEAHPVRYKETGIYSYYADERGLVLRAETRGKPLALEMPAH